MSSDENTLVNLSCTDSDSEISEKESSNGSDNCSDNEQGIIPYNFEPYLSDNDSNGENNDLDSDDPIPMDIQRLQNTEW